jgi:hypothetical protein
MKGITLGRQLTPWGRRGLTELPYVLQPLFSHFDTMMNDRANGADLFQLRGLAMLGLTVVRREGKVKGDAIIKGRQGGGEGENGCVMLTRSDYNHYT